MPKMAIYRITVRSTVRRAGSGIVAQAISNAAHGLDRFAGACEIQFVAQAADMRLNDFGARIETQVPHLLEQDRSWNHLSRAQRQRLQQAVFAWLQHKRCAPSGSRAK